jgi:streptogramin lyase
MKNLTIITTVLVLIIAFSCNNKKQIAKEIGETNVEKFTDKPFVQEYHDGYVISKTSAENDVRNIAVDQSGNVWIATADGVFKKEADSRVWKPVIKGEAKGPSYDVVVDSKGIVWMATWDGVYTYKNNKLKKVEGVIAPISVLCLSEEGVYALGPNGVWQEKDNAWEAKNFNVARSVRDAKSDDNGGLWVATDVGLYHCSEGISELFQDKNELISCYLKGLDFDSKGDLWAGGMGGVTVRKGANKLTELTPKEGIPSIDINSINTSPNGTMWVGTNLGVVRYYTDGSHSLRFSKRWLLNDCVRDVAFDKNGNAWVATANGVSAIKNKKMTLADKEKYFYDFLMRRHIREPWIAGVGLLEVAGDSTTLKPRDDDNDGQYTSLYLVMESFKYAVTRDEGSRVKARKALDFLFMLQTITETEGFFARSVVPVEWGEVNDVNRTYSEKQLAESIVKLPRYKPVEQRWRKSRDGKWFWKGDTSSDEMCGHMLAFMIYHELIADQTEKEEIKQHVKNIMDYIIKHDYNFVDIDGKHTHWGVWSPNKLNNDPEWKPESGMNSLEMLSFLKFTHHITGEQKYQDEYLKLINEEKYLENIERMHHQNEAWKTYIDAFLSTFVYPSLLKYEDDPKLIAIYEDHMNRWFERHKGEKSPFFNYFYCYASDKIVEVENTVELLIDAPLDMIDWRIDHSKREDIQIVREPILESRQTSELISADMRATIRWDKNPWDAIQGNPHQEREPVYWLLPYWMGKYIGAIE